MKILFINGWGQESNTLQEAYSSTVEALSAARLVPKAELETLNYLQYKNFADLVEHFPENNADIVVAWSLGTQIATRLINKGLLKPKGLLLVAPIFQFVETDKHAIGMPREAFEGFYNNFVAHPEAALKYLVEMSATNDVNKEQVLAKMIPIQKFDAHNVSEWLLELKNFSCFDIDFKDFPKTVCYTGKGDIVVSSTQANYFVESIKDAQLYATNLSGHAPHFSATAGSFLALMDRDFLNVI